MLKHSKIKANSKRRTARMAAFKKIRRKPRLHRKGRQRALKTIYMPQAKPRKPEWLVSRSYRIPTQKKLRHLKRLY